MSQPDRNAQRALFARVVQQERRTAILIAALALCAVFIDMAWQEAVPLTSPLDLLLQLLMGMGFLGVLAWHVVNPSSHIQRSLMGLLLIACAGQLGRLYLALFGPGWHNPPDLALPTALGYLPMMLLAFFAFQPGRDALISSAIFLCALSVPTAFYVLAHLEYMSRSPRLLDLMHLALLQAPLTFAIAWLLVRVQVLAQIHSGGQRSYSAGIEETDSATMALNRAGIGRVLEESLGAAKLKHFELTVGYLELSATVPHDELDDLLRQAISRLSEQIPQGKLVVGRWSLRRLALVMHNITVSEASNHCLAVLEGLNRNATDPDQRIAHMAIALYHPGETLARLLKRADDQLQLAFHASGMGLAYSAEDAF